MALGQNSVVNGASEIPGDLSEYLALRWYRSSADVDIYFSNTRGTEMDTTNKKTISSEGDSLQNPSVKTVPLEGGDSTQNPPSIPPKRLSGSARRKLKKLRQRNAEKPPAAGDKK